MAPTPGILYVTMQPKNSLPVSQFHDWYNNEHGPTRLRLSFCQNGFRYRASDSSTYSATEPEWMAMYDIDDMDWLTKDVYTKLRAPPVQSQRERDTMKQITVDRRFYDIIGEWKADGFEKLEEVKNEGEGNVLIHVGFTLQGGQDKEEELTKWYEEEHIAMLQKVPGWRRSRRFVTSYLDIEAGKPKEFVALHEYAPQNGLGGEALQRAITTEWTGRIYENVVKEKRRRIYNLYYTFGAAPRDLHNLTDKETFAAESTDGLTRTFPSSTSASQIPVVESYITTSDDVQIPYYLTGSSHPDAPTLILINSILVTHSIWDTFTSSFLAQTSNKYRILRFNSRGRSSLPESSGLPITVHTYTSDILALMDALRLKTAAVIGVSLGGATALNLALNHPDRISAFISCDTNSVAPPSNPKAWGERIEVAEKEGATAKNGEPVVGQELAELTARRWFTKESYADASLSPRLEEVKQIVASNSLDGFKKGVQALYEYDFRDKMKGYKGKGAFLVGAADGVLPKTMGEMANSLGDGGVHLEIVDGAGHLPMVEKPDEVAGFVAKFLES